MVGVPGRSKGCKTCQARKIACSQERPRCSQCIKSARTCLGYDQKTVFISSTAGAAGSYSKPKKKNGTALVHTSQSSWVDLKSNTTISLYRSAARRQMLTSYMNQFQSVKSDGILGSSCSWIASIPEFPTSTKALETSAFALCTASLGRKHNDDRVTTQALSLYLLALEQIQQALWDPQTMYSDEVLAACMLLRIYEAVECPSNSRHGYLSHHNGCARLIQLRGPDRHMSGLSHDIFVQYRYLASLEAMKTKSTFLVETEWMDTPFLQMPKTALDRLIDIILETPSMMAKGDKIATLGPDQVIQGHVELILDLWGLDNKLMNFYTELEREFPNGNLYQKVPSSVQINSSNPKINNLISSSYRFADFPVATVLTLYWAMRTVTWSFLCHLYYSVNATSVNNQSAALTPTADGTAVVGRYPQPKDQTPEEIFTLPMPASCRDYISMAHNVCMSVEHQIDDEMQRRLLIPPLKIVLDILKPWGVHVAEVAWTQIMMDRIQDTVKITKHVLAE